MQTGLAAKAPSRHLHPPESRRDCPAHGSLQSALLFATMRARGVLVFSFPDRLFERLSHPLLTCFLNTLFHLCYACACPNLDGERYLYVHERILLLCLSRLSFAFTVGVSLFFGNPTFLSEPRELGSFSSAFSARLVEDEGV